MFDGDGALVADDVIEAGRGGLFVKADAPESPGPQRIGLALPVPAREDRHIGTSPACNLRALMMWRLSSSLCLTGRANFSSRRELNRSVMLGTE